jgi:hypothetical protein
MGCRRGTHSSNNRWRRRRNDMSPDNVRLIRSMLSIISKFHLSLEVNHILGPMVQHVQHLCLEESTNVGRRLIIKNS